MSKETCFYCDDTGYVQSDKIEIIGEYDSVFLGQENALGMCSYCEIGQAAIRGYKKGVSIQLDNYKQLQEENEQTLDDLASYIVLCSDLEIENEKLREEIQFLIGGFRVAGWEIKKAECVPIGQMWINSNYDLDV